MQKNIFINFQYVITEDSLGIYAFENYKQLMQQIRDWKRLKYIDSMEDVFIYSREEYLQGLIEQNEMLVRDAFSFDGGIGKSLC